MTATLITPATVPVFPFSIFDPAHVGIDEFGDQVNIELAEKNILVGGEPGGGKSVALNLLVAHAALSADCRLILIDGKRVELGPWRDCADIFVGPSIDDAISAFSALQREMNDRYDMLLDLGLRKITRAHRPRRPAHRHRRVRLLQRHRRHQDPAGRVRRPVPRPGSPRPRRRDARRAGHPAALPPGHRPLTARPVRLPVGVPLHHRLLLRHRARPRLGRPGLHRRRHRPPHRAACPGCCPKPASPAGSRPPT